MSFNINLIIIIEQYLNKSGLKNNIPLWFIYVVDWFQFSLLALLEPAVEKWEVLTLKASFRVNSSFIELSSVEAMVMLFDNEIVALKHKPTRIGVTVLRMIRFGEYYDLLICK